MDERYFGGKGEEDKGMEGEQRHSRSYKKNFITLNLTGLLKDKLRAIISLVVTEVKFVHQDQKKIVVVVVVLEKKSDTDTDGSVICDTCRGNVH